MSGTVPACYQVFARSSVLRLGAGWEGVGEGVKVLRHGRVPCLILGHHCIEGQGFMWRSWIEPRWHESWNAGTTSIITLITVIAIAFGNKKGCIFKRVHLCVAISTFPSG